MIAAQRQSAVPVLVADLKPELTEYGQPAWFVALRRRRRELEKRYRALPAEVWFTPAEARLVAELPQMRELVKYARPGTVLDCGLPCSLLDMKVVIVAT